MACIGYKPSTIMYDGQILTRQDLLNQRTYIMAQQKRSLKAMTNLKTETASPERILSQLYDHQGASNINILQTSSPYD